MQSRRSFVSVMAAGGLTLPFPAGAFAADAPVPSDFDVTRFGAVGDGQTPCWEAFQAAIDAAEQQGGGVVNVPTGVFRLERTPLIASRVHVRGAGPATVLRGSRPDGENGSALISNKGQQAEGYEGAHDWSVSHLAIDSPRTNGIVVTHARNVYLGFVYGTDIFDHFFDIASEHIVCENLFLTGRSGASCFQMDSLSGSQTTWDGDGEVAPLYDGTGARNLILRTSIITAPAGYTGTQQHHRSSVHFHGENGRGFLFSDLILGGAEFGFYQDADSRYEGIRIQNVISRNGHCAAWFGPGVECQAGPAISGLTHESSGGDLGESQRSIYLHGRRDAQLSGLRLIRPGEGGTDVAILAERSESVLLTHSVLEGQGGTGFEMADSAGGGSSVSGCVFRGFETAIRTDPAAGLPTVTRSLNSFQDNVIEVATGG